MLGEKLKINILIKDITRYFRGVSKKSNFKR